MNHELLARGLQTKHARPRNARHGRFHPPIAQTILIILFIASIVVNAALVRRQFDLRDENQRLRNAVALENPTPDPKENPNDHD